MIYSDKYIFYDVARTLPTERQMVGYVNDQLVKVTMA
jgi:hypothetical protein